jgi:hypothetical protein
MTLQTQQCIFQDGSHQCRLRTYNAHVRTRAEELLGEDGVVRDLGAVPTYSLCGGRDSTCRYDVE